MATAHRRVLIKLGVLLCVQTMRLSSVSGPEEATMFESGGASQLGLWSRYLPIHNSSSN